MLFKFIQEFNGSVIAWEKWLQLHGIARSVIGMKWITSTIVFRLIKSNHCMHWLPLIVKIHATQFMGPWKPLEFNMKIDIITVWDTTYTGKLKSSKDISENSIV